MRKLEYIIPPTYDNKKLFYFLKSEAKLSSKLIRRLKTKNDGMLLNGRQIRTIDIVHEGDLIEINIPRDNTVSIPGTLMPDIVYEDEDLLIVNKPGGLAIHESHNHQGDTLANSVCGYLAKKGKSAAFRAVGRLDKGTSGLVVCALNSHAASLLSGKIEKEYTAIAAGEFHGSGTIDAPIFRPDPIKTLRTVDERGSKAVTHWRSIKTNGKLTILKINLETGRTHQIRVHFAHLGAPLIGDAMYGEAHNKINRQALHCGKVRLLQPITKKEIVLNAPLPLDMAEIAQTI